MARPDRLIAPLLTFALVSSLSVAFAALKDWGNRLEGTVDRPHAARDYELLGFYAYRQDFPLRDDVMLRLRFFLPQEEPAYIEARELTIYKQYLMRPKPEKILKVPGGWSEFTGWPVSDVLKPNSIFADNLGVIVRLKTDAEYAEDLAPAILLDSHQQVPAAIDEYLLYLTVSKKLKNLDYQIGGVSGYSRTYKYKQDAKDRSIEGRTVIPVRFSARQFPAGPAAIHIEGSYANDLTAKFDITYRFFHKPL